MRLVIGAALAASTIAFCACLSTAAPTTAGRGVFAYEKAAPLDVKFGQTKVLQGIARQELSYLAAVGLRLKAFFVHPSTGGPWPLVIWSPGTGGDRRQQLPEALDLARGGAASLLIDEVPVPTPACSDAERELSVHVNYVISRRRAVDVAETLANVDAKRIAAAGFSRGAAVTADLAGTDHRIRAFVLRSGRGHLTGYVPIFCTALSPDELRAYVATLGAVDPVRWLRKEAGAATLVQNGTKDTLSPRADVLALYGAARNPKELRWYPAGHDLNAAATAYRTEWLLRHLQIR